MTYADNYNIRDRKLVSWNDVGDALDDILTSSGNLTWTDYSGTITYSGRGSMTYTSVTTYLATYCQVGKLVWSHVWASGTTGGTADYAVYHSLPVTPATDIGNESEFACAVKDATAFSASWMVSGRGFIDGSNWARVYHHNGTQWDLGSSRIITTSIFYKAA